MSDTHNPGRWGVLAIICCALFMIMLQSNVINLAIPHIQKDFGADLTTVSWVTNGYLLVFTVFLLTLGRLGDEIGRKKVFLSGLIVFTLGSALCAFLPGTSLGVEGLILGALVQGLGGAAMMPATMSLIASNFAAKERGMALGLWGATSGLAVAIGPTLGGYLTDVGLGDGINQAFGITQGWRYIYFLNLVFGVVIAVLTLLKIPESKDTEARHRYDVVGIVLSGLMLFSLVFGLVNGSDYGWWDKKKDFVLFGANLTPGSLSLIPLLLVASAVLALGFVFWEKTRKVDPLMDLTLFGDRNFTAGSLVAAILSFAMMGTFFLVPVFLQNVLGYSAIEAGLLMLPMALAVMVASPISGVLADKIGGKWVIVFGMVLMALGGFWTANFRLDTSPWDLVLPFIVLGTGIALAMSPNTNIALLTVPLDKIGGASGFLSTIRQMGSVLGITILVSLFANGIPYYGEQNLNAVADKVLPVAVKAKIIEGLHSGGGMEQQDPAAMDQYLALYKEARRAEIKTAVGGAMKQSVVDSINTTFRWAALVALLGGVAGLALRGRKPAAPPTGESPRA